MRKLLPLALALALPACNCGRNLVRQEPVVLRHDVGSFAVQVTQVNLAGGGQLSGGDGQSRDTAYPFPFGNVVFHVKVAAKDERGNDYPDYQRPVSIRVTPGDLDPGSRWLTVKDGQAEGDILVAHVYGAVSIWAMDQEPDPVYVNQTEVPTNWPQIDPLADGGMPYTHAAGASTPVWFKSPTIVDVQRTPLCDPSQSFSAPTVACHGTGPAPECKDAHGTQYQCFQGVCLGSCDNRLGPLSGDFVSMDLPNPESDMLVTAITQDGFYVSDMKAQKMNDPSNPTTPQWQKLPGTFNSLFVYTYSAPLDLYTGDHLTQLTGSVQEFSGDTQLDFPSWLKVDADPTLDQIPAPYELHTAQDCTLAGKGVDTLCGYYNSNMDLESLESAPVMVRNVKPTTLFYNCDKNGDSTLPLFVNSSTNFSDMPGNWGCFSDDPLNYPECACEISCTVGLPYPDTSGNLETLDGGLAADGTTVCTELTTFNTYGQWEVMMHDPDAGYSQNVRINVTTRDALSSFNPLDLQKPEHQGITFDIAGMLNQVQASRPRWLIYARGPEDVCCHSNPQNLPDGGQTGLCPNGVRDCNAIGQ